jgi:hypothetical protein
MATTPLPAPPQRIGRRLGQDVYYQVTEVTPERLVLDSRPELNRRAAQPIIVLGGILLGFAMILLIGGAIAAVQGVTFGAVAITVALGGLFGGLGMQRIVGGRAIRGTTNQIEATATQIVYRQVSAGYPERSQVLPVAAIQGMRLHRRPLIVGSVLRRVVPIVVLELLTEQGSWVVDSAADPEALLPLVQALQPLVGITLASSR